MTGGSLGWAGKQSQREICTPKRVPADMIRTLAGAVAGIAIAIVLMMGIEALGYVVAPPPALDLDDPNAAASLPVINQMFPIIGWLVATLLGGWVAILISRRDWTSWIVAASVLVGEIADYLLGRHAAWVIALGVIAPLAAAWLAQKLPSRSPGISA